MRVAIIVRGGVVQGVLGDDDSIRVELYDYDNEPDQQDPPEAEYPYTLL